MEFEAIAKEYSPMLLNHIRRMLGNLEDAEDVLQEVLITLFKKQHTFRGDSSFKTWVFRIATNRTIDFIRKNKKYRQVEWDETLPSSSNPFSVVENSDTSGVLAKALLALPADEREIVVLKEVDGFTFKEIAKIKEMNENTVKTKMYTSLKKLREILKNENISKRRGK
jgi:RNA polymerase sigma-70 factor (ECF subfamily)